MPIRGSEMFMLKSMFNKHVGPNIQDYLISYVCLPSIKMRGLEKKLSDQQSLCPTFKQLYSRLFVLVEE